MTPMTFEQFLDSNEIGASVLRDKIARDPESRTAISLAYKCGVMVTSQAIFQTMLNSRLGKLAERAK